MNKISSKSLSRFWEMASFITNSWPISRKLERYWGIRFVWVPRGYTWTKFHQNRHSWFCDHHNFLFLSYGSYPKFYLSKYEIEKKRPELWLMCSIWRALQFSDTRQIRHNSKNHRFGFKMDYWPIYYITLSIVSHSWESKYWWQFTSMGKRCQSDSDS